MASLPMIASVGGSGSELKISVFYTEEFYGETISCSKDSTTLTETATSSGEVEFTVTEEGIWTISCTVDGNLYETDVTVYYDYPATLIAVPDGSAATPTDDIQMWLKCADIRHLNYTSLAQVMADEFTFDTLLRDSNACDYMARSTTWASTITDSQSAMELIGMYDYCSNALLGNSTWSSAIMGSAYWDSALKGLVPTMTSNTTPYGEVVGTAIDGALEANLYLIFADDTSVAYDTRRNVSEIGYIFSNNSKIVVKKFSFVNAYYSARGWYGVSTYKIQGLQDDDTWTDLTDTLTAGQNTNVQYVALNNDTAYKGYRLVILASSNPGGMSRSILSLQFYGHTNQTNIIHSAANDTIYYKDNEGNEVVLATTNANGLGEVDWSLLDTGNYTLYSTVAKNPANFVDDYGKTVKITSTPKGSTTELYVLPRHTLYWYGFIGDNCETISSANGWSSSLTLSNPTYNINNIAITTPSSGRMGVGSKTIVSGTSAKIIAEATVVSENSIIVQAPTTKITDAGSAPTVNVTQLNTVALYGLSGLSGSYYIATHGTNGRQAKVYGLWYNTLFDTGNFISAAYDEVYFYLNGEKVVFAVTDDKGYANLDYSRIPSGFYTLYSSVAKLPNDLSSPYFKRIEITENTTSISLMPDNVLYWYGYEDGNLEDMTTANGWTPFSGESLVAPKHNANNISMTGANGSRCGISSKNTITAAKVHYLVKGITIMSSNYGNLITYTAKNLNNSDSNVAIDSNSLKLYELSPNADRYITILVPGTRTSEAYALWYDTTPVTNPTIYSAAEDTLYILDANDNIVPIATTDSEGKYYGDIPLAEGTYTIYSSVAKDPDNLSNPYSKTVTITNATTEIKVMPDNSLYWWGYKSSNIDTLSSANGYSGANFNIAPTYDKNKVHCAGSGSNMVGIATLSQITATSVHAITQGITVSGGTYGEYVLLPQKNVSNITVLENFVNGTLNKKTITNTSPSVPQNVIVDANASRTLDIYALWYE